MTVTQINLIDDPSSVATLSRLRRLLQAQLDSCHAPVLVQPAA